MKFAVHFPSYTATHVLYETSLPSIPHQQCPLFPSCHASSLQCLITPLHINNLLHSPLIPLHCLKPIHIRAQLRMLLLRKQCPRLRSAYEHENHYVSNAFHDKNKSALALENVSSGHMLPEMD